jgi:arsenate reductase
MAEGLARHYMGDALQVWSAGTAPKGIDPRAVEAMKRAGIDISGHTSKTLADLGNQQFDYVVTLCGHAHETCPFFPGKTKIVHRGFDDPPQLAAAEPDPEKAMAHYERVRDEITEFVKTLPGSLKTGNFKL